jgi:hypothetical protein
VTDRPAAAWVVQQLREAFPHDSAIRHLIFDRDAIFPLRRSDQSGSVDADEGGFVEVDEGNVIGPERPFLPPTLEER